jgi:hypothetical protein
MSSDGSRAGRPCREKVGSHFSAKKLLERRQTEESSKHKQQLTFTNCSYDTNKVLILIIIILIIMSSPAKERQREQARLRQKKHRANQSAAQRKANQQKQALQARVSREAKDDINIKADQAKKVLHQRATRAAKDDNQRKADQARNAQQQQASRQKQQPARDKIKGEKATRLQSIATQMFENGFVVTPELIAELQNGQAFAQHPNLALLYFWLCGPHPDAFIYNGEDPNDKNVVDRILKAIGDPVGQAEAVECQARALQHDIGSCRMAACASCNEVLFENEDTIVDAGPVQHLDDSFQLTEAEILALSLIPAELLQKHVSVLIVDGMHYHLNPDLVPDVSNVVLCGRCSSDPHDYRYSIASGHDYGRRNGLPEMSVATLNAILPARAYNIDILIRSNHSTAHAIAFPSDGPVEMAKVLPWQGTLPIKTTYLGPGDSWRKKAKRFRSLVAVNSKDCYTMLEMWKGLRNPYFEGIVIDDSPETHATIESQTKQILDDTIISVDSALTELSELVDEMDVDAALPDAKADLDIQNLVEPDLKYSAVLPKPNLISGIDDSAVKALIDIIHPQREPAESKQGSSTNESSQARDNESQSPQAPPVVVITRSKEPICEWDNNHVLLGSVFAHLFILGKGVPKGSIPKSQLQHMFRFYDGRFDDPLFIATAFNQLQRHACVRTAARLQGKRKLDFEKLGQMASSPRFHELLLDARDNPHSDFAKKLNASICHLVSMAGFAIPYSPFERHASRSRLTATRLRYGPMSDFVTAAPPEFEDLAVLRQCLVEEWNKPNCKLSGRGFTRNDLPDPYRDSASVRLRLTRNRPSLGAKMYQRKVDLTMNDILCCPASTNTRVSQNYVERKRGAYLQVAAVTGTSEPQMSGRLHFHINVYRSSLTSILLTRLAAWSPENKQLVASVLDSISHTSVSPDVRAWYDEDCKKEPSDARVRAADLIVPDAKIDYTAFVTIAQKKSVVQGTHVHGHTCEKAPKGLVKCRLSMPRGVNEGITRPIMVALHSRPDNKQRKNAQMEALEINDPIRKLLSDDYKPLEGQLSRPHLPCPIVWEQHRPEADKLFVESNLLVSNLLLSHNNSSAITGQDAAVACEEYAISYETKEGAELKQGVPLMLAAMEKVEKYPSRADDAGTKLRTGLHLATSTVHQFVGSHEWAMALMVHALHGNNSRISSEMHRFVFPYAATAYVDQQHTAYNPLPEKRSKDNVPPPSEPAEPNIDTNTDSFIDKTLDELLGATGSNSSDDDGIAGATAYKLASGDMVFLSQADSYNHRGNHFAHYSYLEFESIVALERKKPPTEAATKSGAGRPSRQRFALGETHPLANDYDAVIRLKFALPVPGGRSYPSFPGNCPVGATHDEIVDWQQDTMAFAKYAIDLLVPWQSDNALLYSRDCQGLQLLIHDWDNCTALPLYKMRFRYLHHLILCCNRNSHNEDLLNMWRSRNTDYWDHDHTFASNKTTNMSKTCEDPEARGHLGVTELFDLTNAILEKNATLQQQTLNLHLSAANLWESCPVQTTDEYTTSTAHQNGAARDEFYSYQVADNMNMTSMISSIYKLTKPTTSVDNDSSTTENPYASASTTDPTNDDLSELMDLSKLSKDQQKVVSSVIAESKQQLIFMHGGGGCGKSYAIAKSVGIIVQQKGTVACCAPTGVAAALLPGGKTYHTMWMSHLGEMCSNELIDRIFQSIGGNKLRLVVVDEVSMLQTSFLTLLDTRLRAMYKSNIAFGGISVLLAGDFLQLPTIFGEDLYKVLYTTQILASKGAQAAQLFKKFQVFNMNAQMRAAADPVHCRRLQAFRALPKQYPEGKCWSAKNSKNFKPVTNDILHGLTASLSPQEIANDHNWMTTATCITTGVRDAMILNAARAKANCTALRRKVYRWRHPLKRNVTKGLQTMLYDETKYPELFAYMYVGAPGMILDNGNGNVLFGVANGTRCTMLGLAWKEHTNQAHAQSALEASQSQNTTVVDLPKPPDFIIVKIHDVDAASWPSHLNLAPVGTNGLKTSIVIPVGLFRHKSMELKFRDQLTLHYEKHAVDLALAITVYKSQGGTFDYVIVLLEPSNPKNKLTFETLYVMFSRVRLGNHIRCIPLSATFDRKAIKELLPNIYATKWRMDLDANGKWFRRKPISQLQKPRGNTKRSAPARQDQQPPPRPKRQKKHPAAELMPRTESPRKKTKLSQSTTPSQSHPSFSKRQSPHRNTPATSLSTQTETPRKKVRLSRPSVPSARKASPLASPKLLQQFGHPIHQNDMDCLQPNQWLSDTIINVFGNRSVRHHNTLTAYVATYHYTLFVQGSNIAANTFYNAQDKKLWLIPINDSNVHWQLLVIYHSIHSSGSNVFLMDSACMIGRPSNADAVYSFARQATQAAHGRNHTITIRIANVPQQPNTFDCGVYVLLNIIHSINNIQHLEALAARRTTIQLSAMHWYNHAAVTSYRSDMLQQLQHDLAHNVSI